MRTRRHAKGTEGECFHYSRCHKYRSAFQLVHGDDVAAVPFVTGDLRVPRTWRIKIILKKKKEERTKKKRNPLYFTALLITVAYVLELVS